MVTEYTSEKSAHTHSELENVKKSGTYCVLQIEVLTLYFDSLIQYYNEMRKCDLWEEIAE